MAENTFNVAEFGTVYSAIEENSGKFSAKINQIMSLCGQLSQLVKSTDSSLSNSYAKAMETLGIAKTKVINLLNQLENEMKLYEKNTLVNEEKVAADLEKINKNIENISAMFNKIASKNG